jgi:hypothetical protein
MFRVSWQDYREWRKTNLNQPRPPIETKDFETKVAADAYANVLRNEGLTACVSPVPPPKVRRKKDDSDFTNLRSTWRLHA